MQHSELIIALYEQYLNSTGVNTDTRKILPGELFFALKGGNFNGNKFAAQALNKGATLAIIDEAAFAKDDRYILVENVLETLQTLANYHRRQLKIPFLAITGSNGKTTTKELIKSVLSTTYSTFATYGNLNNEIGVPLSLLSIPTNTEIAVIEMGANHPIEINQLCKVAEPNFGLITNIGKAHLEGFGSFEGVKNAKGELFEFVEAIGGRVFVNANDPATTELAYYIQKSTSYASNKWANTFGEDISDNEFLKVRWHPQKSKKIDAAPPPLDIRTQLIGSYNLDNVLAAITIGHFFKVNPENIKLGIENYAPKNNRSQIIKDGTNTIILDAYNANPSSMEAALKNLAGVQAAQKIAIVGDMMELGNYSAEEHQKLVNRLGEMDLYQIILVGHELGNTKHPNMRHFPDAGAAKKWYQSQSFEQTTILVKGSRGIALEKIIEA